MSSITFSKPTAPLRFLPALACMGLIFYLSDQPKLPAIPSLSEQATSVLGHLTVYFALTVLTWWGLGALELTSRQRVATAFAVAVLYGLSDEWHQSFVPGRTPDWRDLLTDAIGAAIGLLIATRLARSSRFGSLLA